MINLIVGSTELRECEEVVRRKVPKSLPTLVHLVELSRVEVSSQSNKDFIEEAKEIVTYKPDAHVLAEAISANPDWFIPHDKAHFLSADLDSSLEFRIGTPGDIIQALEDDFTKP